MEVLALATRLLLMIFSFDAALPPMNIRLTP